MTLRALSPSELERIVTHYGKVKPSSALTVGELRKLLEGLKKRQNVAVGAITDDVARKAVAEMSGTTGTSVPNEVSREDFINRFNDIWREFPVWMQKNCQPADAAPQAGSALQAGSAPPVGAAPPQFPTNGEAFSPPPLLRFRQPQFPQLNTADIASRLRDVKGLPRAHGGSGPGWAGRVPLDDPLVIADTAPFFCPHCDNQIDSAALHAHLKKFSGPYPPGVLSSEARAALRGTVGTGLPLYGPFFYSGMWSQGRSWGAVPPSYFSSAYNTHTWAL